MIPRTKIEGKGIQPNYVRRVDERFEGVHLTTMTETQRIVKALELLGFEDVRGKSRLYRVFAKEGYENKYLVGKRGALRRTRTSIGSSVSLTDTRFYQGLLVLGSGKFEVQDAAHAEVVLRKILEL